MEKLDGEDGCEGHDDQSEGWDDEGSDDDGDRSDALTPGAAVRPGQEVAISDDVCQQDGEGASCQCKPEEPAQLGPVDAEVIDQYPCPEKGDARYDRHDE